MSEVRLPPVPLAGPGETTEALFAAERTSRERAERLQAVTAALSAAGTRRDVVGILIRAQREGMGAAAGSVWLAEEGSGPLRFEAQEGYDPGAARAWPVVERDPSTPLGLAAGTARPVFLEGPAQWERFPALVAEHRRMGWGAAAVLPLGAGERLLGVLGCSWKQPRRFTPHDRDFMLTVAGVCAQALERATLHSALERSRDEARFLAEASRALASSLDPAEALGAVARMAAPGFADWCAVDLREGDAIVRVATHHHDPARVAWSREVVDEVAPRLDDAGGIGAVVRTGEAAFLPRASDDVLRAAAPTARHLEVWREMGIRSAITVPLAARGRVLGALTFLACESGRTYTPADLELARDLGSRAALAVDNARLLAAAEAARAEAERASQAKTQFLAVMSHELRTPLNAILGYGDLLESGISGPVTEGQRHHLGRIRVAGAQLLELVDQILSLSRIEAGRDEVRPERVDLRDLAAATAGMVEPAAAARGLVLAVRRPRRPLPVVTDAGKVRQILLNLLSNAVKFTESGSVELRVARARNGVRVEVADTGTGIADGELERIFDAFVQGDASATRRHGGSGLGLAVSRELARLLGGELTARSRVGEGSTFVLRLPGEAPAR